MSWLPSLSSSLAQKGNFQMEIDGELEAQAVCTDARCKAAIDLHRDRVTEDFYLLRITLRVLVCMSCFLGTCPYLIMVYINAQQTSALTYIFELSGLHQRKACLTVLWLPSLAWLLFAQSYFCSLHLHFDPKSNNPKQNFINCCVGGSHM